MLPATPEVKAYFKHLLKEIDSAFSYATEARKKNFDPEPYVDVPLAQNMAERVEGLISSVAPQLVGKGLPERIFELEQKYGILDWRVALIIAQEVASEKFCTFKDKKEAMEVGIRVGFLYNTLGIVSAPLEGFINIEIKKRRDGKDYMALKYAGPIRGAGGTAASFSVMIADYVRKQNGLHKYDPDEEEIKRFSTEIDDYHERVTNLQYHPTKEEIEYLVAHIPVEISGEPTEKIEVSNHKDLDRVETNQIRGGMCLVLAEGIAQKAPKLWKRLAKWGKEFDMDWMWVEDFLAMQKKIKAKKAVSSASTQKITPNYTFINDMVAGRPVLTHPMAKHGFRLRYGRSRHTGFSAAAIHPFTQYILQDYIAIGTQLKMERPGKAASIMTCTTIEPPIVKLKNGNVLHLGEKPYTDAEIRKLSKEVEEVLFLGDILFNYGDFSENGHPLVAAGYCPEWWARELENSLKESSIKEAALKTSINEEDLKKFIDMPLTHAPDAEQAAKISSVLGVPLHPAYIFYWSLAEPQEIITLLKSKFQQKEDGRIITKNTKEVKSVLEKTGVPHIVSVENIVIDKKNSASLKLNLGIGSDFENALKRAEKFLSANPSASALDLINHLSDYTIRDKAGTFIGARMGRPEKAKMRKLTGSPQVLFPVGDQGGRMRSFQAALEEGRVEAEFAVYYCESCKKETIYPRCEVCGSKTKPRYFCRKCNSTLEKEECDTHGSEGVVRYKKLNLDIKHYFDSAFKLTGWSAYPDLIKGVRGTSNKDHIPEHLLKGILRAHHDLYVNKDGTVRYDMSEEPLTHFKPKEIRTSIEKLKQLGYTHDIYGNELTNEDQILEIFVQDIVLPGRPGMEEAADDVLKRVADFVDDELVKLYGMKPFYNLKSKDDLVGHLVIGLAPHISAGTIGRIIGFSETQSCFASPLWHAALRRDCDGDEACVILLMDAFLNFSRQYLPDKRGGRTMDAPLVLTSLINPAEVDDQALGVDVVDKYPLEFYEAALEYKPTSAVKIEQIKHRLGKETQFSGFMFTHDTDNINRGVKISAYKQLPSMEEKLRGQMELATKIRAVDEGDVARLVIDRHFIKDTKGNLRKFSIQQFRCVKCNAKYRRPPLRGVCKCGGKIIFTISEGSVVKYLNYTKDLAFNYNVPPYVRQSIEILQRRIEGMFGKEREKQEGLSNWLGQT